MIKKIITGGQSGVEMAALDAAIKLNIPHEGWCHRGRRTGSGFLPEAHQLKPIEMPSYHDRLEKNIIDSDGTVILSDGQLVIGSLSEIWPIRMASLVCMSILPAAR
jgi:hypothetical protein